MKFFTDADLAELIACPKVALSAARREMASERGSRRNDLTVRSATGNLQFRVFLRQSDFFPENFSIGLDHIPKDEPGSFCLIRCNGQHGGTRAHSHHSQFHIHRITATDLGEGIKEPRHLESPAPYASFREALQHFCSLVNLAGADMFCSDPMRNQTQWELPLSEGPIRP